MVAGGEQVLLVDDAHHVVDALVVHRQAGVALGGEHRRHVGQGGRILHGDHVHPGGEDIPRLQVVKADGGADELALLPVQAALVLGLLHHGDQLLVGDALVLRLVEQLAQQLFPQPEQEVQRGEHRHEQPQQGRGEHGERLGGLLGQALGGNLAKNQHHHGEHDGGHRGTVGLVYELDEQQGGQGGGHVVDDVVADEDGGQQLVVVLGQGQGFLRLFVAVVGAALQADAVDGGHVRFSGGKVAGHDHHQHQHGQQYHTVRVHGDKINS